MIFPRSSLRNNALVAVPQPWGCRSQGILSLHSVPVGNSWHSSLFTLLAECLHAFPFLSHCKGYSTQKFWSSFLVLLNISWALFRSSQDIRYNHLLDGRQQTKAFSLLLSIYLVSQSKPEKVSSSAHWYWTWFCCCHIMRCWVETICSNTQSVTYGCKHSILEIIH